MSEDSIVSVTAVASPFMEELHAAFDSISKMETLFLSPDAPALINDFHARIKKMFNQVSSYAGSNNIISELDELFKNQPAQYVPSTIVSFHMERNFDKSTVQPNIVEPVHNLLLPACDETVKLLKYPKIHSFQFALIDDEEQIDSLLETLARTPDNAIGVCVIDQVYLQIPTALCISTRECEYLIDLHEIPDALIRMKDIFSNPGITKVFHNTAHCCHILHKYGVASIYNVFCITSAAVQLGLNPSLESLTADMRKRLNESWIPDINLSPKPYDGQLPNMKDSERLVDIVEKCASTADHFWLNRPFSVLNMRISRQRIHYLLYLYDSLRLKLKEKDPNELTILRRISHHKAELDWSTYRFFIDSPNTSILSALYEQPPPPKAVLKSLNALRIAQNAQLPQLVFSDAVMVWLGLTCPKNQQSLLQELTECSVQNRSFVALKPYKLPQDLMDSILQITEKCQPPLYPLKEKKVKELEDIITELGWLPVNDQTDTPKKQMNFTALDTTVSPRVVKVASDNESPQTGKSLKHLRDPDQPTPISKQIEGIPKTESQIFALANNVRLLQKINGKTKTKLAPSKEETVPEESSEDILKALVNVVGYISESEAQMITDKINAQKQFKSNSSKPKPRNISNFNSQQRKTSVGKRR